MVSRYGKPLRPDGFMNYSRALRSDELMHFGVLGMKWGVRRYQNPDGTLTEAGKRRYDSMTPKRLHKELKKQVQNKRAEIHGGANRWMHSKTIGENSKRVRDTDNANRKAYESTPEYKSWEKKVKRLERKYDAGNGDLDTLDKQWDDLMSQKPKENWNSLSFVKVISSKGEKYTNNFLEKGGKDLSIAYLQDLGYDKATSEKLVKKLIKGGKTLGDV